MDRWVSPTLSLSSGICINCVCVCVRERERERERERVHVCARERERGREERIARSQNQTHTFGFTAFSLQTKHSVSANNNFQYIHYYTLLYVTLMHSLHVCVRTYDMCYLGHSTGLFGVSKAGLSLAIALELQVAKVENGSHNTPQTLKQ